MTMEHNSHQIGNRISMVMMYMWTNRQRKTLTAIESIDTCLILEIGRYDNGYRDCECDCLLVAQTFGAHCTVLNWNSWFDSLNK